MSEFWVKQRGGVLVADDHWSAERMQKFPSDTPLRVDVRKKRNGRHHRLYWVMCQRIADAVGTESAETVSDILKIATGHCKTVRTKAYGILQLPASIAWSKMDQAQFKEFFDKCVVVIAEEWSISEPDLIREMQDVLGDI